MQTTSIVERRTILLKRLQRFREIQQVYMPGFDHRDYAGTLHAHDPATTLHAENVTLYMPSELSISDRRKYCPAGLAALEDRI
jgi:small nuclear ribonucleoprotein (snRNP)-like protein